MTTHFSVELEPGQAKPPPAWIAGVRDVMLGRLSGFTVEALKGSVGMYRLRDDMLDAARSVDPHVRVKDLIIHELRVE